MCDESKNIIQLIDQDADQDADQKVVKWANQDADQRLVIMQEELGKFLKYIEQYPAEYEIQKLVKDCCTCGDLGKLKELVNNGAKLLEQPRYSSEWTNLTAACYNKNYRVVKYLLDNATNKNKYLTLRDSEGNTCLMWACKARREENYRVVECLLNACNDKKEFIRMKNDNDETCLLIACDYQKIELVELLLANIDNDDNCVVEARDYVKSESNNNELKELFGIE
jgi:ankyrin repeat protein